MLQCVRGSVKWLFAVRSVEFECDHYYRLAPSGAAKHLLLHPHSGNKLYVNPRSSTAAPGPAALPDLWSASLDGIVLV